MLNPISPKAQPEVPGQLGLWDEKIGALPSVIETAAGRDLVPGRVFHRGEPGPPVGTVVRTPGGRLHTCTEEGWIGAGWSWRELVGTFSGEVVLVRMNPPGLVPDELTLPS